MRKILIAVPCGSQVATGFCASIASMKKPELCSTLFLEGSLIYDARNKIARTAVEIGSDLVMWFDSDMIIPIDTIVRLLDDITAKDLDIVSGLYFQRVTPYKPVLFRKLTIECGDGNPVIYDGDLSGIKEVEGIGFGCVLMKTQVLEDVLKHFGTAFSPIGGVGEDLSFCWRARELGYKIHADLDVKLGHVGHMVIDENFFRNLTKVDTP